MIPKFEPKATPETAFFWEKARARELWLPRCVDSGRAFFPPRSSSPYTGGAVDWVKASGRATLASFVIVHRPAPGFEGDAPYIVALAQLEEGPRLITNLPGTAPDPAMIPIGAPLNLLFEERGDMVLPQFRIAEAAA